MERYWGSQKAEKQIFFCPSLSGKKRRIRWTESRKLNLLYSHNLGESVLRTSPRGASAASARSPCSWRRGQATGVMRKAHRSALLPAQAPARLEGSKGQARAWLGSSPPFLSKRWWQLTCLPSCWDGGRKGHAHGWEELLGQQKQTSNQKKNKKTCHFKQGWLPGVQSARTDPQLPHLSAAPDSKVRRLCPHSRRFL